MDKLVERFLQYIKYNTVSENDTIKKPSTEGQLLFGKYLKDELEKNGISVQISEYGVVYAHVDSNVPKGSAPTIGFVAHMDTPPDFNADNIHPQFISKYDGGIIIVNKELGLQMTPAEYPFLNDLVGHEIIHTDGTSILGADDKASIAEVVTMLITLVDHPEIKHGDVYAAFTVDEEIGKGIEYFDLSMFPCDFAYTVDIDGNDVHCLDYETICNGRVDVTVTGKPVHPGNAAGVIQNASELAMKFHNMLPKELNPYYSTEYEGFNHLQEFTGKVDYAYLRYRVANFENDGLWNQMRQFETIAKEMNDALGYSAFSVKMNQRSYNMRDYIMKDPRCLEYGQKAMQKVGLKGTHRPIRGGTDGSLLSIKGLPTPNISNGSYNAISYFEMVSVTYMRKCVELLLEIVTV